MFAGCGAVEVDLDVVSQAVNARRRAAVAVSVRSDFMVNTSADEGSPRVGLSASHLGGSTDRIVRSRVMIDASDALPTPHPTT